MTQCPYGRGFRPTDLHNMLIVAVFSCVAIVAISWLMPIVCPPEGMVDNITGGSAVIRSY